MQACAGKIIWDMVNFDQGAILKKSTIQNCPWRLKIYFNAYGNVLASWKNHVFGILKNKSTIQVHPIVKLDAIRYDSALDVDVHQWDGLLDIFVNFAP